MIAAAHGVPRTPGAGQNPAHRPSRRPFPPPYGPRTHTSSGEVTQGKTSGWDNRMGPYSSRDEAEHALQIARERTRAADEWDED